MSNINTAQALRALFAVVSVPVTYKQAPDAPRARRLSPVTPPIKAPAFPVLSPTAVTPGTVRMVKRKTANGILVRHEVSRMPDAPIVTPQERADARTIGEAMASTGFPRVSKATLASR